MQLMICEWHGATVAETLLERPSWEAVESAVRALNNRERNDLYLTPSPADPETYLAIGGGAGRYLVSGSIRNEEFRMILDQARTAAPAERLTVGGQGGVYPATHVVDLAAALWAARDFFDAGGFSGSDRWVKIEPGAP